MSFFHSLSSPATIPIVTVLYPRSKEDSSWFLSSCVRGWNNPTQLSTRYQCLVSFISKAIEKIVALQQTLCLGAKGLLPAIQSSFRKDYSTEILLIRIFSYVYGAIDRSQLNVSLRYRCSV